MLLCLVTDMVYVGQTKHSVERRFAAHCANARKGSRSRLCEALRTYGRECFEAVVLERCQTQDELNRSERYWIEYCSSREPGVGYNDEPGGNVRELSDEARAKCKAAAAGAKKKYGDDYFKRRAAEGARARSTPRRRREDMTPEELQRYAEWGRAGRKKQLKRGDTS